VRKASGSDARFHCPFEWHIDLPMTTHLGDRGGRVQGSPCTASIAMIRAIELRPRRALQPTTKAKPTMSVKRFLWRPRSAGVTPPIAHVGSSVTT